MICKVCKIKIRYGGASAYNPARESKMCPKCYNTTRTDLDRTGRNSKKDKNKDKYGRERNY